MAFSSDALVKLVAHSETEVDAYESASQIELPQAANILEDDSNKKRSSSSISRACMEKFIYYLFIHF